MPARATKKTEAKTETLARPAASPRRGGRPRAATAAARIYSDLRAELVSLQRHPGEAVSEAEIALSYGVSRTPVREAILKLSDEGLLEIFPQSGIFVSRIPLAALPEAIVIRKALEATTAQMAAQRATASQILNLHSILERQREADAAGDSDAFHQADETFHATIAEVAGYPGIWTLIQQVKVHVDRYRRLTLPQVGRIKRAIGEHEAILDAIEAHDPNAARGAMELHLERLLADISATQSINPEFFDERN
jgi:DNA-binding GntR family transcriptional regulator